MRTRVPGVAARWWRPAFAALLLAAAGVVVLAVVLPGGRVFLPMVVLMAFYAWVTWRLAHARVDLDDGGMTVHRLRRRRLAWSQVRALRLDPRGGPRLLRAETARGELVDLPELDGPGTQAVLDARAAAVERG